MISIKTSFAEIELEFIFGFCHKAFKTIFMKDFKTSQKKTFKDYLMYL